MNQLQAQSWYTSDRFRSWAIGIIAIALLVQTLPALLRDNDYLWHKNQGDLFLAGTPIGLGTGLIRGEWYPLSRSMFDAAPALLPQILGKGLFALVAVLGIAYTLRAFAKMTTVDWARDGRVPFAAAMFALIATVPFLNRDLDDGGLQCLLLGMLALAGALLWQGRPWSAGFWLGSAIAYKFTPILFLPLLIWKRQFRAALAVALTTLAWNLAPAVFVGWDNTLDCHRLWWQRMAATRTRDIAENSIEPPNRTNQGLMAACARYLQTYPAGHPLPMDHPLYLQFGQLSQDAARLAAQGIFAVLGLAIAWGVRRPWHVRDPRFPHEWAVGCIFTALISPLCWRQHLVVALPAAFLLWRAVLAAPQKSALRWQAIVLMLLVLVPQREILGRALTDVLLSYKLDTLALLGYTALLFRIAPVAAVAPPVEVPDATLKQPIAAQQPRAA